MNAAESKKCINIPTNDANRFIFVLSYLQNGFTWSTSFLEYHFSETKEKEGKLWVEALMMYSSNNFRTDYILKTC